MPSIAKSPARDIDYDIVGDNMNAEDPASPHSSTPQFGSPTFASQSSPASSTNRHSKCQHVLMPGRGLPHELASSSSLLLQVPEKVSTQLTPAPAQSFLTLVSCLSQCMNGANIP